MCLHDAYFACVLITHYCGHCVAECKILIYILTGNRRPAKKLHKTK